MFENVCSFPGKRYSKQVMYLISDKERLLLYGTGLLHIYETTIHDLLIILFRTAGMTKLLRIVQCNVILIHVP